MSEGVDEAVMLDWLLWNSLPLGSSHLVVMATGVSMLESVAAQRSLVTPPAYTSEGVKERETVTFGAGTEKM